MIRKSITALAALFLVPFSTAQVPADHAAKMKAGLALFTDSIQPLFKEHCLRCHGGEKTRADLDLATRESLLAGGEGGPVLNLEKPGESFLLDVIRHDEEPTMPPKKPRLSDAQIASVEKWITLGAPYAEPLVKREAGAEKGAMQVTDTDRAFWSFKPLAKTAPPKTEDVWVKGDIDRFVLAQLWKNKLAPNPPAEAHAWIRRVHLDLIGLPPTPEEMSTYTAALVTGDPDKARAFVVDQLLDSPRFGERWARHWLDAARFAESHGFEQDYDRKFAYHFRDFVIKAFNADMPYDQFVKWQIAGDEFAPDDPLAMLATGFLGAGVFPTQLTEKEFESARYDELDDMAATTGTAMLGLTIGCARCHDHKFDPIPVKDYYEFVSTFTTTIRSEIDLTLDSEGDKTAATQWENEHKAIQNKIEAYRAAPDNEKRYQEWLGTIGKDYLEKGGGSPWQVLSFEKSSSQGGATLTPQADGSVLVTGKNPAQDTHSFTARVDSTNLTHLRIEVLTHDTLPRKGPGRAGNGNFALSDLKVSVRPAKDPKAKATPVTIASAKATHQQNTDNLSVASSFDSNPTATGWAVDFGGIGKDQAAVFHFAEPIGFEGGSLIDIQLVYRNNGQHSIGRPRLSVSAQPAPPVAVGGGISAEVQAAVTAQLAGKANEKHHETLWQLFVAEQADYQKLAAELATSESKKPVPSTTKVQVTSEGFKPTKHHADGRGFPHFYPETHHLQRGDPSLKGEVAEPGFLTVLMKDGADLSRWQEDAPEGWRTSYRRRSLANWMTDTEEGAGHLLARVIVNRVWHHHFGRGLVATPNDFGLQGSEPSHPALLDHLATQLIADGWKLKPLHRRIALSAAYAQSTAPSKEKAAIDPDNAFLWRFTPRRLEAEVVRDSMLHVSGQLDTTMHGPGTLNEAHKRRSIYFQIKRSRLVPIMQIFDQPEPLVSQGSRPSTTIAPQALLFMNNTQVLAWAKALGQKTATEHPDDKAAVQQLYLTTLGRPATEAELAQNLAFLKAQSASYEGATARPQALADLTQVLFSLNEFIYLP